MKFGFAILARMSEFARESLLIAAHDDGRYEGE